MKCVVGVLGILVLALLMPAPDAAQARTTFGVSVTVTYNCAMDTSKLTPEQRKVVEDYCRSRGNQQNGAASSQQTGK